MLEVDDVYRIHVMPCDNTDDLILAEKKGFCPRSCVDTFSIFSVIFNHICDLIWQNEL